MVATVYPHHSQLDGSPETANAKAIDAVNDFNSELSSGTCA